MRAAVFKGVGRPMVIEPRADPRPLRGQVILEVGRCGICSSDLHMTSGQLFTFPEDSILGHEYAGVVVELGEGIERLRVGDIITALPMGGCGRCAECLRGFPMGCASMQPLMSGYAERAVAAEKWSLRLPRSLSVADGALIEPLASALHGVAMAGLRPGDCALVLGAGPIGLATMYWARRSGASSVLAVARSRRHAELALHMGATHFLEAGEDISQRVIGALGQAPPVVFECIGSAGALGMAVNLAAPRGTIVVLGMCMNADTIVPALASMKSLVMRFSAAYDLRDFEAAAQAMDSGGAEPRAMVSETIGLDDFPQVFEELRQQPRGCKILVRP